MTNEKLYEVIGDISDNKIKEAKQVRKGKQPIWLKWGTMVACICLVVASIIGVGITQSSKPYTAILNNGNQIIFYEGDNSIKNSDMKLAVEGIRELTETEASEIFGNIDVDADVGFEKNTNEFIYLGGSIDNFKVLVLRSDIPLDDTFNVEKESISVIDGVSVSAGYFLTKANSQGNKTAIVYASFEVENYTIYIETAGNESERDNLCNALAEEIQKLLEKANLDFEKIK